MDSSIESMSKSLPYSMNDVNYDNGKFRQRSRFKVITRSIFTINAQRECIKCTTGRFLAILMIFGVVYLISSHTSPNHSSFKAVKAEHAETEVGNKFFTDGPGRFKRLWEKPRRSPRLSPDDMILMNKTKVDSGPGPVWKARQKKVKEAFMHAWSGYRNFSMGYDELMPLSRRGVDGLGGLGATIVDALDTALIMGIDEIALEAGSWIEKNLLKKIEEGGQVNLFETTIRIVGGLLSAYHLSGGNASTGGPRPVIYLENAKKLADRLIVAFTSSPSDIPFSDVVLKDRIARPAPDGLSSTAEAATLQLEFSYLSALTGDRRYAVESMKVLEHMKTLPKVEGLVPIYINPHTGKFSGENIRLGSRGDSYYEYLVKVWLQNPGSNLAYLRDMYNESMKGVKKLLVRKTVPNGLVFVGELPHGAQGDFSPKMDHLVCFLPGTLALGATKGMTKAKAMGDNLLDFEDLENLKLAEDLTKTCYEMYSVTSTGLAPEIAYFKFEGHSEGGPGGGNTSSKYVDDIIIKPADRHNLLRPETVESFFYMYRITEDPKYREWGWEIFEAFEKHTKVDSGGYTSLDDVTVVPQRRRDKMETFFLGETLKYLYLLFGDSNVLPLEEYVFNTEAHPFPIRRRK